MNVTFTWLKEFVDIRLKPAELAHRLTMAGFEVESVSEQDGDTVFDVNVTPNRGDCLSVMGLAREVAAITGTDLKPGRFAKKVVKTNAGDKIKSFVLVELKDKKKCQRYAARVVRDVAVGPSPDWLAKRLTACGLRPINNIVDATNYMMLETGQPFHAFDHRELRGHKIVIDSAGKAMGFVTLDEIERKLTAEDLLICDAEGPVAVAGVMGGLHSGIKDDTKTVVLESACFDPVSVRRTSKKLGLLSESSKRFEKGVDPNTTVDFMNRLAALIVEIAGGQPTADWVDIYPKKVVPEKVSFSIQEANRLIGADIKPDFVRNCFKALGIGYSANVCTIPTFRPDITRSADVVEEVARLYGYDNIPADMPDIKMSSITYPSGYALVRKVKDFMQASGFFEAVNYGFASPTEVGIFYDGEPVKIANPLGIEFSAMRTTLIGGLLANVKLNVNNGRETVKLFELRPVFNPQTSGRPTEEKRLTAVIYGRRSPVRWTAREEDSDFFDIKGVAEALLGYLGINNATFEANVAEGFSLPSYLHPQASCLIKADGREIGCLGFIHPKVLTSLDMTGPIMVLDIAWEVLTALAESKKKFKPLDKFQGIRRDVALLVPLDLTNEKINTTVKNFGSPIIRNALPFDLYKGKGIPDGKKSVAYAVWYFNPDRTLTDDEVSETHTRLVAFLKDKLGAEVR